MVVVLVLVLVLVVLAVLVLDLVLVVIEMVQRIRPCPRGGCEGRRKCGRGACGHVRGEREHGNGSEGASLVHCVCLVYVAR